MASKRFACKAADVPDDRARIVPFGRLSVGIFRLDDGFHALLNVCPHRGASLCEGPVCGTTRETAEREFVYHRAGELIRCAWHGWEFDIRSGEFIVDPRIKARTFEVSVENGDIYVHV